MRWESLIAVDWGTTNRRVFLIDGGAVAQTARDDRGALVDPEQPRG